MKFVALPRFRREFKALPAEHQKLFTALMPEFSKACDAFIRTRDLSAFPTTFRARPMTGRQGIWELTWSFASPDGRATFEFVVENGEAKVRWRRIGRHDIYREP